MRIFNVVYARYNKRFKETHRHSIVLIDKHPLVWVTEPPDKFSEFYLDTIDSWTEVLPQDVESLYLKLINQNFIIIEDYSKLAKEGK